MSEPRFCQLCATPLAWLAVAEDGGPRSRLRCPACGWTHWNNPTPVLAAIIEYRGQVLLARNAAWPHKMYALITGFMEAGETPQQGIAREIKEETNLEPAVLEPAKCLGWRWCDWPAMPQPLFAPLASLFATGFVPASLSASPP